MKKFFVIALTGILLGCTAIPAFAEALSVESSQLTESRFHPCAYALFAKRKKKLEEGDKTSQEQLKKQLERQKKEEEIKKEQERLERKKKEEALKKEQERQRKQLERQQKEVDKANPGSRNAKPKFGGLG